MAVANPTFVQRVDALAAALGTDVKSALAMIAELQTETGDITALTTASKSNLVVAINELKGQVNAINIESIINDGVTGGNSTWSSSKIADQITTQATAIANTAVAALDAGHVAQALAALTSLQGMLNGDETLLAAIQAIQAKSVRVDIVQSFTLAEQAQGRANIGAASAAELDDLTGSVGGIAGANFVATYNAARSA